MSRSNKPRGRPGRLQLGEGAERRIPWRGILVWGGLLVALTLLVVRFFVVELVVVRGNTMAPGLLDGDVFSILRYASPQLGDAVLIEHEGRAVVRRIVGLAGDRLASDEGQLVRNDALVETRAQGTFAYLDPVSAEDEEGTARPERRSQRQRLVGERLDARRQYPTLGDHTATARPWAFEISEVEVPADHVFVLCDNRRVCEGDALTGVVPLDWIVGVVGSIWWTGDARVTAATTSP